MTQGERVKAVRKSKKVNLTMEKFGERLGVTKTAISLIESGKNNVTDANIKAICREFGVDYIWLTTGEGEMFADSDDDFIEKIDRIMVDENEARKNMIKTLLYASDEDIEAFQRLIDSCASFKENKKD